ncbi:MAG: hypothetical protein ACRDHP_14415 [Ktedonobacterales bacterium]
MSSPNTPEQRENSDNRNLADSGTLNEGYGQSEELAEDHWSEESYQRSAQQIDGPMLDEGEPHVEGQASDIDRMVGGIMGGSQTADDQQENHARE